jgi:transcriptional regulator CtsR
MRFANTRLFDVLKESIGEKIIQNDNVLTFQQKELIAMLVCKLELMNTHISEEAMREMLIFYNFNNQLFVEFEIEKISSTLRDFTTIEEGLTFLQKQLSVVVNLKIKTGSFFEPFMPSVKQQLAAWINTEIKNYEMTKNNTGGNEFIIDLESKIQTSLSVAKLAVLIRLLVADKIIINKSVAPMLRTVARLFTTLQKNEISFGSLETKYHAPDKNTISIVKEMLQKWVALTSKL